MQEKYIFTLKSDDILDIVCEARQPCHKRVLVHAHFDVRVDGYAREVRKGDLELSLLKAVEEWGESGEAACPCRDYPYPFISIDLPYDPFTTREEVVARLRHSLAMKLKEWAERHGWEKEEWEDPDKGPFTLLVLEKEQQGG